MSISCVLFPFILLPSIYMIYLKSSLGCSTDAHVFHRSTNLNQKPLQKESFQHIIIYSILHLCTVHHPLMNH